MSDHSDCVAIIGLACRFPGARTPQAFWHNLRAGVESISFLSDQELEAAGVASAIYNAPGYVKAASELEGVDRFDAEFFGFNPREAELTDPQHRQFLEVAHEALEVAGYDPGRFDGSISVFAGAYANTYVQAAVLPNRHRLASTIDPLQLIVANDKDYLPTLVSYKLNLRGPSIGVQAACSTSLVAVHLACQSLMLYQCDLALAGAASVKVPQRQGYFYREGGLLSPDGHCRPFDADAQGTIFGSGVGVVVLKRLEEAIADGDTIEAVILGSAINNDGARKAAFTAPGVVGQEEVTATAHHLAEVDPETISFIEAHGTGTPLGDSVEIAALKAAFATTAKHRFCALGSVKSNFGHLDAAAGIAGLIKTVLSLKHDLIPPSLHYRRPNPEMRLEDSPFYVNTELAEWPANGERRRAGVSSFGIGGTNAHVVLEQAPAVPASIPATACQLLVLSARTGSALDAATARLADHLRAHPDLNPADVAYTLQVGRRAFAHRRMLVCRDLEAAVAALANGGERLRSVRRASETPAAVILLFPDAGAEYPGMGAELYRAWLVFREQIDRCAEILGAQRGSEVRSTLRAAFGEVSGQPIPPWAALPMLFATEYALARLWTSWGVRPTAMIGHGLGEYVAACLAGVLSLEDALGLALRRGGCAAGDTIAEPIAASVALRPPQIPYVSNVTGTWITPAEATDPEYWSRHLRCRVRFAEGLSALGTGDVAAERVLLEAGPGQTLCALARRHPGLTARAVVPSMRQQQEPQPDQPYLLEALGRLWLQGVEIDWEAVHDGERRRRIALPTYPFEGRRYWIEDAAPARDGRQEPASPQLYERPQETGDYVAPRTEVERTLARIWQALLGIEPVGRNDNFLKLGGHSLLATRLFTRVRQEFKVDLPLRTIFETATLEELARQIEESAAAPAPPPLVAVARCQTLPLSFAQQRLWVLDQLRPGTSFYNIPAGWHLRGPLNVAALGASLDEIVRRHEPLRTRFSVRDGKPYQEISPPAPIPLPIVDLTALAADRREATGVQLATAETRRPFDLARGPVLRNLLLRLGAEEHALLVTVHHIASDAWSMGLFISELQTLHQAFCTGLPAGLPKLPVQYADFSIWQRSWLTGAVLEEELAWWARRLRGAAGVELPGDRPRPALQAPRGRRLSFQLTRPLSDALHKLGQEHGATLYMTLLAAFQTLIYGYTGQSDVVVGSPVANRNHPLLERMIGFFVNMLAMRSDLSGNPSFEKLLAQVVEMTLDSFRNQDLPFEKVVDLLLPERDLSRNPIFQLVLAVQNAPMPKADMGELSVAISTDSQLTRFDLEFHLRPGPAGLHGLLAYDGHLFDATTIRRLAGHFRHLLEGIVEDPSRRLGELPLMDAAERWQMVAEWNCAQADYDRDVCLHELFEAQAARRPQAVAVVCGDRTLRYGELNDRANRLAHRLIALGVRAEKMVGVCIEPSLEMVVALLAVLKAGGAYVPIDPDYPAERIGFILRDVAASALLTRSWIVSELGEIGTVPLCLDEEDFAEYPATDPPRRAGSDQTAYVIFTSGSTGRPKGVILQHRPVVNLIEWVNHTFAVGPADRVLMVASMCFDLSVYDVFGLLAAGGSTHVATGEEIRDPEALVQLLDSGTVTFWDSAPAALNQLVPFLPAPGRGSRSLRLAFLSGDWIPLTLQPAMVRAFPALRVIGLGGATEAAVWSNFHAIDEVRPEWLSIPYGVAIQNARYYVLDARLQPCPLGVAGDLYIGGECLSWGYYRRPQLTAERYVPDPSSDRPGGVLYTTGDRARWRTAGYLEFLGRLDTQVKIRGYRIELGEIEAALREHGAVRQVVAMVREDQPGNRRLVAYAVADSTGTAEQLRQLLQRRLPGYMVPSAIVILDSLPLTPNGKVDRRALPVPERVHEEPEALGAGPQPRTPAEQQLVRIVGELLGNERVGVEDNFFELGGDSILGIQLVSRARDAGLEISPRQVFESPTIGDLAALVESAAAVASPPVRRVAQRARDLPLLPAQLWFLELDRADPHHFNQSLLLTTPATLRHQHLMRAIDELRRCHQALALRFLPQGLAWRQRYEPPAAPAPCHRIDLSALPSAARAPVLTAAAAVLQAGLSLSTGPIFRAAHFVLGAGQPGRLLLIGHHLAVDGVSWRILLADLETACRQLERGVVPELPPPAVSLGDWGERLAEHGRSEALAAEADGWLAQRYRRCSALPQDLPDGVNDEASARRLLLSPAAGQTRKLLQDVPRAARVQLEEVLLAALAETLSRWAGGGPVLVDLEGHGREPLGTDVDLSRTVGWFTSIYPVVLEPDENAAPGATLRRVKETLRRMPHRGIGYGVLCYLGQDRALARRLRELPRPEVIFNYFGQLDPGLSRSSLLEPAPEFVGAVRSPRALRSHRHEINAHVSGGQLTIAWTWSANLHREATIRQLADDWLANLRTLIDHCLSPAGACWTPSDFPLAGLGQETLDRLLAGGPRIEDLHPLSPLQQGMLFHSLRQPESGEYVEQLSFRLTGPLAVDALEQAWSRTLDNHTALRSAFAWEGLEEPLQMVCEEVEMPWRLVDWRGRDEDVQQRLLAELMAADRAQGFELKQAPLMRMTLVMLAEDRHQLLWSFHHLLLDGWSMPLVLRELFERYDALERGRQPQLLRGRPYRDYVAWLRGQDLSRAERYWRRLLGDFDRPTVLPLAPPPAPAAGEDAGGRLQRPLDRARTEALEALARRHRLTLNTLTQGAWALLLSRYCDCRDVVFGVVVSGRSVPLPGIESMV
ncbi:MAG: amino acid adenylation domain-containing protein, partial [bacterium]|nr:amino acid adenylation domain-containing protein [bacterium]